MTIKEQVRILDNKIRQNKADYDLYRQNAKISAPSSGELNKYEYLTGEDLGYRPDPVLKARFEYSPFGEVFNKELNKNERKEGLLKRLKNIGDKADNQLGLIREQGDRQLDLIKDQSNEQLSLIVKTFFRERVRRTRYFFKKDGKLRGLQSKEE